IILASASPRRKFLLRMLLKNFGLNFEVIPANIAEYIPQKATNFGNLVCDLARLKAAKTASKHKGIIIGADTIVVYKGKILGKPVSKSDAMRMLGLLSGNEHKVYTGLIIIDKEIRSYSYSGSPMDKAGAYGIQDDLGSTFVEKITGDYFNIVGLPVVKTYLGLNKLLGLGK